MYTAGKILLFTPYHFSQKSQEKYFIVLHSDEQNSILASMPTKTDRTSSSVSLSHGCIEHPDTQLNCYHFKPQKVIANNGFSFSRPTFLYGASIEVFNITHLSSTYVAEGVDYKVIGELRKEEYEKIIKCFRDSNFVTNKYRKIFETVIPKEEATRMVGDPTPEDVNGKE